MQIDKYTVKVREATAPDTMSPREVEVRDKDRRWFSMRIRPYRTTENRIEGVVVVLVDIDSLKRGEEAIRASAERLRLVQHLAPVGIFEADAGGSTATTMRCKFGAAFTRHASIMARDHNASGRSSTISPSSSCRPSRVPS